MRKVDNPALVKLGEKQTQAFWPFEGRATAVGGLIPTDTFQAFSL